MLYNFQLRHLPSNGFVRKFTFGDWGEIVTYYIAPAGTSGTNLTNSECREALAYLCSDKSEDPCILEEFILIRTPR